jgi:hypothetical protein
MRVTSVSPATLRNMARTHIRCEPGPAWNPGPTGRPWTTPIVNFQEEEACSLKRRGHTPVQTSRLLKFHQARLTLLGGPTWVPRSQLLRIPTCPDFRLWRSPCQCLISALIKVEYVSIHGGNSEIQAFQRAPKNEKLAVSGSLLIGRRQRPCCYLIRAIDAVAIKRVKDLRSSMDGGQHQ